MKRYYWNWDSSKLIFEEWEGSYEQITEALNLRISRWNSQRQDTPAYPLEPYGKGSRVVVVAADLTAQYPDSEAVNRALRVLEREAKEF